MIRLFPTEKGDLFSWGCGNGGRLGQGHLRDRFTPLHVDSLDDAVVFVACHEFHSAAICGTIQQYMFILHSLVLVTN